MPNVTVLFSKFKAFVEKYLIQQNPEKYTKVSVKYDNQIVTTLNRNFAENDSIIAVGKKELAKLPIINHKKEEAQKNASTQPKEEAKPIVKKAESNAVVKPKTTQNKVKTVQKKEVVKAKPVVKKPAVSKKNDSKPKAKVKIE